MADIDVSASAAVVLWWIPVGAGGRVVRHTSRWWELIQARLARRDPRPLFHAAMEATVGDGTRYVIEMAPAWSAPLGLDRGVAVSGPVGLRALGRWRLFRYEVRCWADGTIPDRSYAVGGPVVLTTDRMKSQALVSSVRDVPSLTWGRNVGAVSDMWNSNSVVSWLLVMADMTVDGVVPPQGGWAPGWRAGIALATSRRHDSN
ncbi:hypothetical protein CA982_00705 [Gordonia lacunae]|uniref:Uncharacterized protein n=1 Tax=Gordonia lacunae TaxID=417102 RepID=A0A2C9ZK56_9ACTN|nr:hypothetical protein CA982_00705 [Gordonia lacunae]